MLKDLAFRTGNETLVVIVMIGAILLFALLLYGAFRTPKAAIVAASRLPLDEDGESERPDEGSGPATDGVGAQ